MSDGRPVKPKRKEVPPTICGKCYAYLSTCDGVIAFCRSCESSYLISPPLPPEQFGPSKKEP